MILFHETHEHEILIGQAVLVNDYVGSISILASNHHLSKSRAQIVVNLRSLAFKNGKNLRQFVRDFWRDGD